MLVEVPRRWRWVIGALAVVSLSELVALWRSGAPPESLSSDAQGAPRVESSDVGNAVAAADMTTADTPSAPTEGSEEVEVCGTGWMRATPEAPINPRDLLQPEPVRRARDRLLAALRAGGSEFDRAVAQWLTLRGTNSPAPGDAQAEAARDGVARLAASTRDPKVYALAYNLCLVRDPQSTPGACQLIEARQWARLDPDNASPWMHVLGDAAQRKDRATQDEALYRIATSRRTETYFTALPGAIARVDTPDAPTTAAAMALSLDALGVANSFAFPGYQALLTACRGDALTDANRRQNCQAIAALMTERSDSLLERGIGARMSVYLGAPEARVDEVRGEIIGYSNSFQLAAFQLDAAALDCRTMHGDLQRLAQWSAIGEVKMAHNWARESGKTPEMLGDEFRALQERQRLAAQREAAASAAPAASERRE